MRRMATLGGGLLAVLALGLGIGLGGARLAARHSAALPETETQGGAAAWSAADGREARPGSAAAGQRPDSARVIEDTRENALPRGRETGWERAAPRAPLGPSAVVPLKPEAEATVAALPPPPPPDPGEPRPTLLFQPVATAAGRIEVSGHTVEFDGIEVLDSARQCETGDGGKWPCGTVARAAFRAWLRGRAVQCTVAPAPAEEPVVSVCRLGREDAAAWLVRNGLAEASPGGPYEQAGAEAKAARRGIYGDRPKRVLVTVNGGGGVLSETPAAPAPESPAEARPSGGTVAEGGFPPTPPQPGVAGN